MSRSTAPLTPLMLAALQGAKFGRHSTALLYVDVLTHATTFRGLVARELITLAGALTPAGVQVHVKANQAPVSETATDLEVLSAEELAGSLEVAIEHGNAEDVTAIRAEIDRRLSADIAAGAALAEDRYFTHGAGADTLKRDTLEAEWRRVDPEGCAALAESAAALPPRDAAEEAPRFTLAERAAAQVKRNAEIAARAASYVDRALPQREPGKALLEELLGGEVDEAMGLPAGVTDTEAADVLREHAVEKLTPVNPLSVLLRPVRGELVDRATRETFVAVGDVWGALEGSRVRIVCEDSSDMLHSRPLMFWPLRQSWDELHWADDADVTTFPRTPLLDGTVVQINGWAVYQVRSRGAGEWPHLVRIN